MQELNLEDIKKIVHGAARIENTGGKISFFRFTKEQQELYKNVCSDFFMKSFSTSGIGLEFDTDSENLSLSVLVDKGSSRSFFTHSIFVNSNRIGELSGNIGDNQNVQFDKKFQLGQGMKRVKILFPWSVASSLHSLELDDNSKLIPVKKKCNILMLGDSITQGYDAMIPENAYAIRIAELFDAEARNKGIAGEQFFAKLALIKEDFKPDIITVAYGTNDWRHGTKTRFERECKDFFHNLRNSYPDTKIYAITPLWRVDIDNEQKIGEPLSYIADFIKQVATEISDMVVIDGMNLIPHDSIYYQTDGVHPIDSGFEHYTNNLWKELQY